MKTTIYSIMPSGYGHKEIKIQYSNGKIYKAVTSDMPTFDTYNSETFSKKQEREKRQAEKSLIRFVKRENNLK